MLKMWCLSAALLAALGCGKKSPPPPETTAPTTTTVARTTTADAEAAEDAASPADVEDTAKPEEAAPPADARYYRTKIEIPGGVTITANITITGDTGTIDIPMQRMMGVPLQDVSVSDLEVGWGFRPPGAPEGVVVSVSATRDEASGAFTGELDQMGTKLPVRIVQLDSAEDFVLKRPQTPKPPWPYETESVAIEAEGAKLGCTLSTPKGDGPFAAVAFFTGSGPQDRDENLFEHKPFLVISDALVKGGVATLRCDDRGVGESSGDLAAASLDTFVADGLAMVQWLAAREDIDKTRIGALGHSEGGVIVAGLAKEEAIAFGVMLAGPARSGREVSVRQNLEALLSLGVPREQAEAIEKDVDALFQAMVEDASHEVLHARARALAERVVATEGLENQGVTAEMVQAQFVQLTHSPWLRSWVKTQPAGLIAETKAPFLALYGDKDQQVPGADHAAVLQEALERAGKTNGEVELVENANHLFQPSESGAISEYEDIEQTIQPAVLERVVSWIKQQVER